MRLFGIRLFESREDPALAEVKMAVLQGLLDAQRGDATPQERYEALLRLGDQELGKPPSMAAPRPPVEVPEEPLAVEARIPTDSALPDELEPDTNVEPADEMETEQLPEPRSIQELETARLVELLETSDDE
jgi:hypothetical protein